MQVQGQITKFRHDLGVGIIEASDGRKFRFYGSEIKNPNGHLVGHDVDFLVDLTTPRDIILLAGSPWTAFGAAKH